MGRIIELMGGVEAGMAIEETPYDEWSMMTRETFSGAPSSAIMYESNRGMAIIGKGEEGLWRVGVVNDSLSDMTTYLALSKKEAQALVSMLIG